MLEDSHSRKDTFYTKMSGKMYITVELLYNEPLYSEVLGITINYLFNPPKNSKIYGNIKKNLDIS